MRRTKIYYVHILTNCYGTTDDVWTAIEREKQIRGWRRSKKVALVESGNPLRKDLSEDWL